MHDIVKESVCFWPQKGQKLRLTTKTGKVPEGDYSVINPSYNQRSVPGIIIVLGKKEGSRLTQPWTPNRSEFQRSCFEGLLLDGTKIDPILELTKTKQYLNLSRSLALNLRHRLVELLKKPIRGIGNRLVR